MKIVKPRIRDTILPFDIEKVENVYNSKFVIEVAGGALFYSDYRHHDYPDSYFLLYPRLDIDLKARWYVANGKTFADKIYEGFIDRKGEFVHSRNRHDFRLVEEGLWIDGGQDYVRIVGDYQRMQINMASVKIEQDKLIIVEKE